MTGMTQSSATRNEAAGAPADGYRILPDRSVVTAALEVSHLRKRYGQKVAVDDLSLRVAEGEIFGILGPNGAGKTTTV
jgi:ABC-type uncharacterized transport system ATPase subunit